MPEDHSAARSLDGAATWACGLFCLGIAGLLLLLAGGPIGTSDLWWHLAMGESYAVHGLAPGPDPLLHTGHAVGEVHHEWLFGVAGSLVERAFGFGGLRVAHALAVTAILGLVFAAARRTSGSAPFAWTATAAFAAVAWWRLVQLRPDLASMLALLLFSGLLLEAGERPSWVRVALSAGLLALWANLHSLFMIGPLLVVAVLCGLALRRVLSWAAPDADVSGDAAVARRLGAALGLGLLAATANPRGIHQHLTFLSFSEGAALSSVGDEWNPFNPFRSGGYGLSGSFLSWATSDAVLVAFGIAAASLAAGFLRTRTLPTRREAGLLGLGAAGIVAMLVSVRFQWMLIFAMLFVGDRAAAFWPRTAARGALAAASAAVALGFATDAILAPAITSLPRDPTAYLSTPYRQQGYPIESIRFLREAGLRGNLYNSYVDGGFLGYWLAPTLRTFIDGRTERYPKQVMQDYLAVKAARGARQGEGLTDVLERRGVDVFVGSGLPIERRAGDLLPYTTAHMESAPGWLLVFRSVDEAVYLRANETNRKNLERVVSWYASQGVSFDPGRGLDVARVAQEHTAWATRRRLVPNGFRLLRAAATNPQPAPRWAALGRLAPLYGLLGAYEEQVATERERIALRPAAPAPRHGLIWALLRLGRGEEAFSEARALVALAPNDPRATRLLAVTRSQRGRPATAALNLPLLSAGQAMQLLGGRFAASPPLPARQGRSMDSG